MFYRNVHILYRFRDTGKNCYFLYLCVSEVHDEGEAVEISMRCRCEKTRLTRLPGSKNFDDMFSRFDTDYECDRQTDGHHHRHHHHQKL